MIVCDLCKKGGDVETVKGGDVDRSTSPRHTFQICRQCLKVMEEAQANFELVLDLSKLAPWGKVKKAED